MGGEFSISTTIIKIRRQGMSREKSLVLSSSMQYENSTDQFNPMDAIERAHTTGMERSAAGALAAIAA